MSEFRFEVYSRRHGGHVTYSLRKTSDGWHLAHIAINGDCKPDGSEFFYRNFDQNYINFPSGFGLFLNHVWSQLDAKEISNGEAQSKLQELAEWVSLCERNQPNWKGWNI
ncbi:MAG: hypothetical protein HGA47_08345 [Zoogloea sp.]|nr:hypothetical protein [Zoogloea sp.]